MNDKGQLNRYQFNDISILRNKSSRNSRRLEKKLKSKHKVA